MGCNLLGLVLMPFFYPNKQSLFYAYQPKISGWSYSFSNCQLKDVDFNFLRQGADLQGLLFIHKNIFFAHDELFLSSIFKFVP
jgi:hypothetical protein